MPSLTELGKGGDADKKFDCPHDIHQRTPGAHNLDYGLPTPNA